MTSVSTTPRRILKLKHFSTLYHILPRYQATISFSKVLSLSTHPTTPTTPHHTLPHPTTPHYTPPHPTTPHHTLPHPTTPHHTTTIFSHLIIILHHLINLSFHIVTFQHPDRPESFFYYFFYSLSFINYDYFYSPVFQSFLNINFVIMPAVTAFIMAQTILIIFKTLF